MIGLILWWVSRGPTNPMGEIPGGKSHGMVPFVLVLQSSDFAEGNTIFAIPGLVNLQKTMENHRCLMGKSTISMAMFNSYVSLPEGSNKFQIRNKSQVNPLAHSPNMPPLYMEQNSRASPATNEICCLWSKFIQHKQLWVSVKNGPARLKTVTGQTI